MFLLVETLITNPLPSQITAIKGARKDLHCTVQSDPAISVHWRWTKDGSPVDTSRMTLLNDGTLRINTVRENDAGTYVCRVESVAGNATTSGTLSVQGAYLYIACNALPFLMLVYSFFMFKGVLLLCSIDGQNLFVNRTSDFDPGPHEANTAITIRPLTRNLSQ